jgi:hypothetical protein
MMGWASPIFLRKRSFCGCYNFLTMELEDLDMNIRVGYVAITIWLLALAGAGCSSPGLLTGDDGSQTTLLATATPTLAAATDSLDLDAPEAFQEVPGNYSIQLDFSFAGTEADGSPVEGQLRIEGVHQADPAGTDLHYTASGDATYEGVDEMQFVELGGKDYIVNSRLGCADLPSSERGSPFTSLVEPAGFLTGAVQRIQPDAEINGVPSFAYAITRENLDTSDAPSMEVSELSGTLNLAQEGGYVTRLVLEGSGSSAMLSGSGELEGDINYQLDFTPLAGPVSVSVPAACTSAEGEQTVQSEYPVMSGATGVAAFEGFLTYSTSSELNAVVGFYKTEMVALGWALDNELNLGTTAVLNFTQGATSVGIVINEDPNNGQVSVVLAEE